MKIKIERSPFRPGGFIVTFGRQRWSIVDLGIPPYEKPRSSAKDRAQVESIFKMIGDAYEKMGGRVEAMTVPDFQHQIRGTSFREVIMRILTDAGATDAEIEKALGQLVTFLSE